MAATIYNGNPGTPAETYQIMMNLAASGAYWVNSYDYGYQATPESGTYATATDMFSRTPSARAG